ncbi:MAG: asparagine synthase (glutamine-hydrolyzing) [Bacteroidia bacterium]
MKLQPIRCCINHCIITPLIISLTVSQYHVVTYYFAKNYSSMCGISGIIKFDSSQVLLENLKSMTSALAHRGPDGEGFWIHENKHIGLGHRRLAIIDLSDAGKQPMHYNDRYTIIFNGEIYNYIELKADLIKQGFQFKTCSDTEVLLALYHHKKEKCLDDLDGMFAFALWDEKEQHLFCARDRFGEKPFYYHYEKNKHLIFASEIKALWAAGITKKSDDVQLFNFIALHHLFEPFNRQSTFYENVVKLPAGHYMTVDKSGTIKKTKYWEINADNIDHNISFNDACEKFKWLMTDSVSKRLRADVPVGSSLSGGLDSSLIVCLIDQIGRDKPVKQSTFSARFKNFEKDEGAYMEQVIKKTGVNPHFIFPDDEMFLQAFDKMTYHIEEPFGTGSVTAQYAVMQLAKENNITVLLDGQGADEVLAGYTYMFYHFFLEQARYNFSNFKREKKAYRDLYQTEFITGYLFWLYAYKPAWHNRMTQFKNRNALSKNTFVNRGYLKKYAPASFASHGGMANNLNQNLSYSISSGQLEDLLKYADRNSMAHSREIRLPFLNHALAEFLFTLPSDFKIKNGYTKYLMRESFKDLLPPEIGWRKDKVGYETPFLQWMQNPKVKEKMISDLKPLEEKNIITPDLIDSIKHPEKHKDINGSDVFRCWVSACLIS